MTEPGRSRLVPAVLIALVLALGVFLRFSHLGDKLLWHDEVATRIFAAGYDTDDWKRALYSGRIVDVAEVQAFQRHNPEPSVAHAVEGLARHDPQHPPLYYVLARAWVTVFGDGVATLRTLSVLASLLGLPAAWWLCKELYGSARVAWTGVALGAVSPFFVLYAQEAREYALWSVLILLSCAALLRAIRLAEAGRGAVTAWATYAFVVLVGLYTSFSTASVILAQVLYVVLRERGRPNRVSLGAAAALSVSALLFLPWALALLRHYEAFQASMAWSRDIVIPRTSLLRILAFNTSRVVLDFWPELEDPLAFGVVGLVLVLMAAALVAVVRGTPRESHLLVGLLVAVPIGMMLCPDLVSGGIRSVSSRYLTPAWVGLQLALAFFLAGRLPLLGGVLALGVASCFVNASRPVVWTKGTSTSLPHVAALVNEAASPLVVGNIERSNPGNLLALANLLKPGTRMQFVTIEMEEAYVLPRPLGDVFLFGPIPPYREALESREDVATRLLCRDLHLELWKVEPLP